MSSYRELVEIFSEINDPEEMDSFFQEIFTPKEINDISLRWELLKELYEGNTQRGIAEKHGISLCKITRGSKVLKKKRSITLKLLQKHDKRKEKV